MTPLTRPRDTGHSKPRHATTSCLWLLGLHGTSESGAQGLSLFSQLSDYLVVNKMGALVVLPCASINPWILTSKLPVGQYWLSVAFSRPATYLGKKDAAHYRTTQPMRLLQHDPRPFYERDAHGNGDAAHICKDAQSPEADQPHACDSIVDRDTYDMLARHSLSFGEGSL